MNPASSLWISIGSFSGLLSVAFGAFGAHALEKRLDEHAMAVFKTASQYQFYHALALVGYGLFRAIGPVSDGSGYSIPGWSFTLGTIFFCGSLYALSLTGVRALGAIAPVGGLLFMAGWLTLAIEAFLKSRS